MSCPAVSTSHAQLDVIILIFNRTLTQERDQTGSSMSSLNQAIQGLIAEKNAVTVERDDLNAQLQVSRETTEQLERDAAHARDERSKLMEEKAQGLDFKHSFLYRSC